MLQDDFGFAERQKNATFGLRYNLTLRRNNHGAVFNEVEAIADAGIEIDTIHF